MELDVLTLNRNALGEAAKAAIEFVVSHVRFHSDALKVQTSWGNYLSSLSVHVEQVDFDDPDLQECCMDNLILKAAIWQDDHWVDWSVLLKVEQLSERLKGAVICQQRKCCSAWIAIVSYVETDTLALYYSYWTYSSIHSNYRVLSSALIYPIVFSHFL